MLMDSNTHSIIHADSAEYTADIRAISPDLEITVYLRNDVQMQNQCRSPKAVVVLTADATDSL